MVLHWKQGLNAYLPEYWLQVLLLAIAAGYWYGIILPFYDLVCALVVMTCVAAASQGTI